MEDLAARVARARTALRETVVRYPAFALAAVVALMLVLRLFERGRFHPPLSILFEAALPVLLVGFAALKLYLYFNAPARGRSDDLEMGTVSLAAACVVVQVLGGLRSPLYPLIYLVIGLVVGFTGVGTSLLFVLLVGSVEFLSSLLHGEIVQDLALIGTHLVLMSGFSLAMGTLLHRERRKVDRAETVLERLSVAAPDPAPATEAEDGAPVRPAPSTPTAPPGLSFELDGLLFDLLRVLQQAVGARGAVVLMLDREGRTLVVRQSVTDGVEPTEAVLLRDLDKSLAQALAERKWVLLSTIDEGDRVPAFFARGERSRSLVAAPVVAADRVLGLVLADSAEPGRFGREQARLVAQVADFAGQMVERAARFDELRSEVESVRALERAARALIARPADVAAELCRLARQMTGASAALVARVDGGDLVVDAADGADGEVSGRRVPFDEGLAGRVIQGGESWVEPDLRAWEKRVGRAERRPILGRAIRLRDARGLLIVPIAAAGRRLGALICLADREEEFREVHLPAMEVLAALAGQGMLLGNLALPAIEPPATETEEDGGDPFTRSLRRAIESARTAGQPLAVLLVRWQGDWPQAADRVGELLDGGEALVQLIEDRLLCVAQESADALAAGRLFVSLRDQAGDRDLVGGVAVFPAAGRTAAEILARAQIALSRAQADGGGRAYAWASEALHRV